ncbi:MAG: GTP 3',8-cyclase MoaA [Solirubrobacteraceae bacterium]|jgi:cyclic pyranopterin phosphate synthase
MQSPLDLLGRPLRDLRISVTDRCNLRCGYCMPREFFGRDFAFMEHDELLRFEELERVCRVFAQLGVRTVRLTGGEPLLRRNLEQLVAMIAAVPGIEDVALTTNGTLLAAKAATLRDAGLRRVTVSLDALEPAAFRAMSDTHASLGRVLAGIDAAQSCGLQPVKINMVVRRGVNDHCVLPMAEHFRGRPEIIRFIEYMDVGTTNGWRPADVVPTAELLAAIAGRWPLDPLPPDREGAVATRYRYRDGAGEIGFIHSISAPFCASCTRARLSAEGRLYTCLFARTGHDVRALLRGGATDDELRTALVGIWTARADRYSAERAERIARRAPSPERIEMSYIGG